MILTRMFHEPQHLRYAQHRCLVNHQHFCTFRPELKSLKRSRPESAFRNSFTLASVGESIVMFLPTAPARFLLE